MKSCVCATKLCGKDCAFDKVVCDKVVCVCDKVVCERLCLKELYVKDCL